MEQQEIQRILNEVFDVNVHDTRYAGGTAALYAAILGRKHKKNPDKYEDAAHKFIDETIEWHEERRHDFEPHPLFEKRILEIIKEDHDKTSV